MYKTPRERIESLLKIHGGHCFIVAECADFASLEATAKVMQSEGLVTVTSGTGTVPGLDVKRKGYRVRRADPSLVEPPTR